MSVCVFWPLLLHVMLLFPVFCCSCCCLFVVFIVFFLFVFYLEILKTVNVIMHCNNCFLILLYFHLATLEVCCALKKYSTSLYAYT